MNRPPNRRRLQPFSCPLAPCELARAVTGDLVFLDSSLADDRGGQLSLLAVGPRQLLKGRDWSRIEDLLEGSAVSCDLGLPSDGLFGFVTYEGDYCFGLFDELFLYDHAHAGWYGTSDPNAWARNAPLEHAGMAEELQWVAASGKPRFLENVRRAQEHIAAGDIYQVNLSQCFTARWPRGLDAWTFYESLRTCSPAPYSAFIRLGGRTVLSASPEQFLHMSGREIQTRPIKGTRPRHRDPHEDERLAYELQTSAKEIAELIMITDLERNDLGQVCEFGSVTATDLLKLERYEQVFHLVSTVRGRLREEISHCRAFRACFPGGSITGAPKKRAREIIADLENGERGVFSGAIGYFGFNGESQFNIAIRTAELKGDELRLRVGAGIVSDSQPELEYEETLQKAEGFFQAARSMPLPVGGKGINCATSVDPRGLKG